MGNEQNAPEEIWVWRANRKCNHFWTSIFPRDEAHDVRYIRAKDCNDYLAAKNRRIDNLLDELKEKSQRIERQKALTTQEYKARCVAEQRIVELEAACRAFVEAYEKSSQLEKTDVALRMTREVLGEQKLWEVKNG